MTSLTAHITPHNNYILNHHHTTFPDESGARE